MILKGGIKKHMLNYNRRGQMMMIGIMILIMAVLIFIATLPALQSVMDSTRGCSNMNCVGYIDPDASGIGCSSTNQSYDPTLSDNGLSCTILDLFLPFLILGIMIALITKLLHGGLVDPPQPQYSQYPGAY